MLYFKTKDKVIISMNINIFHTLRQLKMTNKLFIFQLPKFCFWKMVVLEMYLYLQVIWEYFQLYAFAWHYIATIKMCIVFLHINPNPRPETYRVILIMNRDEFYSRPTSPASWINLRWYFLSPKKQEITPILFAAKSNQSWLVMISIVLSVLVMFIHNWSSIVMRLHMSVMFSQA